MLNQTTQSFLSSSKKCGNFFASIICLSKPGKRFVTCFCTLAFCLLFFSGNLTFLNDVLLRNFRIFLRSLKPLDGIDPLSVVGRNERPPDVISQLPYTIRRNYSEFSSPDETSLENLTHPLMTSVSVYRITNLNNNNNDVEKDSSRLKGREDIYILPYPRAYEGYVNNDDYVPSSRTRLLESAKISLNRASKSGERLTISVVIMVDHTKHLLYLRQSLLSLSRSIEDLKNGHIFSDQESIPKIDIVEVLVIDNGIPFSELDHFLAIKRSFSGFKFFSGIYGFGLGASLSLKDDPSDSSSESELPYGCTLNQAISNTTGQFILLLSQFTEIHASAIILMLSTIVSQSRIGIVGPKLAYLDDTIKLAGRHLLLGKDSSIGSSPNVLDGFKQTLFGVHPPPVSDKFHHNEIFGNEILSIFDRFEGMHLEDGRSLVNEYIAAVSRDCLMITRTAFDQVKGFDVEYLDPYLDVDLSFRVRTLGLSTVYVADAIVYYNYKPKPAFEQYNPQLNDITRFTNQWAEQVVEEGWLPQVSPALENVTISWSMACYMEGALGLTTEAIQLILALHNVMRMKIEADSPCNCRDILLKLDYPIYTSRILQFLWEREPKGVVIKVLHRNPGEYRKFYDPEVYNVGRSVFETDRVPSHWIHQANTYIDRIWVPSHFNIETFAHAGINKELLRALPECIDVYHFDPKLFEPLPLPSYLDRSFDFIYPLRPQTQRFHQLQQRGASTVHSSNTPLLSNQWKPQSQSLNTSCTTFIAPRPQLVAGRRRYNNSLNLSKPVDTLSPLPTELPDPNTGGILAVRESKKLMKKEEFRFLSIGKWERRKGHAYLLRAYFDEFTNEDGVSLHILMRASDRDREILTRWIINYAEENPGRLANLPPLFIISENLSYKKLPGLYKGVNCFVLASHGEGWGLPLMEAMAMELPTIATDWSGNIEFMTNDTSFLIRGERLEVVEDQYDLVDTDHRWAIPSVQSLRQHLRFVYQHRQEAKIIGRKARRHIINQFGYNRIASFYLEELSQIKAEIASTVLRGRCYSCWWIVDIIPQIVGLLIILVLLCGYYWLREMKRTKYAKRRQSDVDVRVD